MKLDDLIFFDSPSQSHDFAYSNELEAEYLWLQANFQWTPHGFLVVKNFGYYNNPPDRWLPIQEGRELNEDADQNRFETCGHGINFGTWMWHKDNDIFEHDTMYSIAGNRTNVVEIHVPYLCLLPWDAMKSACFPSYTAFLDPQKSRAENLFVVAPMYTLDELRKAFPKASFKYTDPNRKHIVVARYKNYPNGNAADDYLEKVCKFLNSDFLRVFSLPKCKADDTGSLHRKYSDFFSTFPKQLPPI